MQELAIAASSELFLETSVTWSWVLTVNFYLRRMYIQGFAGDFGRSPDKNFLSSPSVPWSS